MDLPKKLEQKKAWAGMAARLPAAIAAIKVVFFNSINRVWQKIISLLKKITNGRATFGMYHSRINENFSKEVYRDGADFYFELHQNNQLFYASGTGILKN